MATRKRPSPPAEMSESATILAKDLDRDERMYDFGNTPVLILHPGVNRGAVMTATLTGYWVTKTVSREKFAVIDLAANLVLPEVDVQLPGDPAPRRVRPGTVYLGYDSLKVPTHLRRLFPSPNTGRINVKERFYTAVFAATVNFPFATADDAPFAIEPAPLLWLNAGSVGRGGALNGTSLGRIIAGALEGLQLCCGCGGPKPPAPAPRCGVLHPRLGVSCTRPAHFPRRGSHYNGLTGAMW